MFPLLQYCCVWTEAGRHGKPGYLCLFLLQTVCDWVHKVATKPVWSKMSPNVTDIKKPARSSLSQGQQAFSCSMHTLPGLPFSNSGPCGFKRLG